MLCLCKAQYEFIHYALSELVVCGETEIVAANLRSFIDSLRNLAEGSGSTISQQHMTVCFLIVYDISWVCSVSLDTGLPVYSAEA